MKPTQALCQRLRFTTKDVGRGFYRGNRTGSMGAHTQYGAYIIDWRKVRHYNVPDLAKFELTPFVSKEINPRETPFDYNEPGNFEEVYTHKGSQSRSTVAAPEEKDIAEREHTPDSAEEMSVLERSRAIRFLTQWRTANPQEFLDTIRYQQQEYITEQAIARLKEEELQMRLPSNSEDSHPTESDNSTLRG